ncbi:MAG: hypothetical protein V9G21_03975 [Methylotenera sp.]
MSDSFNKETTQEEEIFHPGNFVHSLCENKKVHISSDLDIKFSPGWKSIVESFIASVSQYAIYITQMTDTHMQLDISFEASGTTKELIVWRAVEEARRKSRAICAICGQDKFSWRNRREVSMYCESCKQDAGKLGKTGTWLDGY